MIPADTAALLRRLTELRNQLATDLQTTLVGIDETVAALAAQVGASERRLRLLDAPALMTITAAARYLGVSKHTIYGWLETGRLTGRETDSGRTVILKEDVDALRRGLPPSKRVHRKFPEDS